MGIIFYNVILNLSRILNVPYWTFMKILSPSRTKNFCRSSIFSKIFLKILNFYRNILKTLKFYQIFQKISNFCKNPKSKISVQKFTPISKVTILSEHLLLVSLWPVLCKYWMSDEGRRTKRQKLNLFFRENKHGFRC